MGPNEAGHASSGASRAPELNPRPEAVRDGPVRYGGVLRRPRHGAGEVRNGAPRPVEGEPVAHAARAFGLSRPSFYEAAASLDEGGLPALVPAKPGPRGAHKLTEEVVDHLEALLAADQTMSPADLAARRGRALRLQRAPTQRRAPALARRRRPKSGR